MRIDEIANAQEQLALWRLISDTIWQVFDLQQAKPSTTRPVIKQSEKNRAVALPTQSPVSKVSKSKRPASKARRPAAAPTLPPPKLAKPILPISLNKPTPKPSSLIPIKPISPITSIGPSKKAMPNITKNLPSAAKDALNAVSKDTKIN